MCETILRTREQVRDLILSALDGKLNEPFYWHIGYTSECSYYANEYAFHYASSNSGDSMGIYTNEQL